MQEAFDLHHEPRRAELIGRLCPPVVDPVWGPLRPHQDITIEPVVMGKGSFRVSCRATLREAPAS